MKLLSPFQIGDMRIKNRLVMAPMTTNYAREDQHPSERLEAFLTERARGGVGLITVEVCTVDVKEKYQPQSMTLGADEFIDSHRRLTDAIHEHGAKAQPQITHPGPESMTSVYFGGTSVGPSHGMGATHGLPARALEQSELPGIIDLYAQAAYRARQAGYDGIELHAAHAYMLLGSFLSPLKNKRQDEYGCQTPENRIRLLVEVLQRIKQTAGEDFPITLRISGFERVPGGRDSYDTATIAPTLVAAGVDAFHVSGGISDPMVSQMICGSEFVDGYNLPEAEAIRRVVDVPVMAVGRFLDPEFAEQTLQEDRVDAIVMGRPLLADPHLPNKLASDRINELRRCISCANCIDSMFMWPNDARMNCAVNAASGREQALSYPPAQETKHVLVIGAGPAGMEAARVASERGHRVTLLEQRKRLGGSLILASTVHKDNGRLLDFLKAEMARLPITIRLGAAATPTLVKSLKPDQIVVATGATLKYPDIDGIDGDNVITGSLLRELVNGKITSSAPALPNWVKAGVNVAGALIDAHLTPERLRTAADWYLPLGKKVVIIGADLAAIEVAEFLARSDRDVVVLEPGPIIAPEIGPKRRLEHEKRLEALRVSINCSVVIDGIDAAGVKLLLPSGAVKDVKADSVVVTGEPAGSSVLFDELCAAGLSCVQVGDANGLGLIVNAIYQGAEAAHQL